MELQIIVIPSQKALYLQYNYKFINAMIKVSESAKLKVSSLMKDEGFDPLVDFVRVG